MGYLVLFILWWFYQKDFCILLLLPIFFSNPQHYLQTSRVEFESQIKFPLQEQNLHEFNISIPDNDDGDDGDDDAIIMMVMVMMTTMMISISMNPIFPSSFTIFHFCFHSYIDYFICHFKNFVQILSWYCMTNTILKYKKMLYILSW